MNYQTAVRYGSLLAKLSRPQNIMYSGLLAVVVAYAGNRNVAQAALCYLTIWLLYALAATFNNLQDSTTDRYNRRHDNPLTQASAPPGLLTTFVVSCSLLLAMLQPALHQPWTLVICALYVLLLAAYSHSTINLQSRGLIATAALAACYGGLPTLLGASQWSGGWSPAAWQLVLLQMLWLAPLLLAKDYKDEFGDRLTGKRTPLVRYGPSAVAAMACSISGLAALAMIMLADGGWAWAALIYVLFVAGLHQRQGKLPQVLRHALSILLLVFSWQLLV